MPHIYKENNKSWKVYKDEKECINNVVYAYLVNENEYDGEEKIDTRFFEITDDDCIEIYQKFSVMTKLDFSKPEGSRAGELFIMVETEKKEDIEIYLVDHNGEHITEIDNYFSLDLPEGFSGEPETSGILDSETSIMIDNIKSCSRNLKDTDTENAVTIEMTQDFKNVLASAIGTAKNNYRYNRPLFAYIHFVNADGKLELHSTTGSLARIIKTAIQLPSSFVSMSIPCDILKYLWQYKNPDATIIKLVGEISKNNPDEVINGIIIGKESYFSRFSKPIYKGEITRVFPTETSGSIICNSAELQNAVEKLNEQYYDWAKKKKLLRIVPSKKYKDLVYVNSSKNEEDDYSSVSMFFGKNNTKEILIGAMNRIEDKEENCVINITQDLFSSIKFSFRGKTIATVPAKIDYSESIEMNVSLEHLNAIAGKNSHLAETVEFKLTGLNKAVLVNNGCESTVFMPF